jgi:hypothetical protein
MEPLGWLSAKTLKRIEDGVATLKQVLGKDLLAVLAVGSAVNPARADRDLEPELLVVVTKLPVTTLGKLAQQMHGAMRQGLRLRVLTDEEMRRSADVFALEMAEYRDRHVLTYGSDPFADITIAPADLRRSLEQGLRGLGRRMRNRVLAGLGTDGARDNPNRAVAQGIERLLVLAHHALGLLGEEPPRKEDELLEALAAKADADAKPLIKRLAQLRAGEPIHDPIPALGELLSMCDGACRWIDELEVAR